MNKTMNDIVLSVVIPCYNEKNTIETVLDAVRNCGVQHTEIIVVDDYSTDGTRDLLQGPLREKSTACFSIRPIRAKARRRWQKGFQAATGDVVVIQDADTEYDPKDFVRLLEPLSAAGQMRM